MHVRMCLHDILCITLFPVKWINHGLTIQFLIQQEHSVQCTCVGIYYDLTRKNFILKSCFPLVFHCAGSIEVFLPSNFSAIYSQMGKSADYIPHH